MTEEINAPSEPPKKKNTILYVVIGAAVLLCFCCALLLAGQYILENSDFSLVNIIRPIL